ncbi:MAG: protein-disulfide reductase DsbD domain-containing protein [Pseudomonadota bacterium]
MLSRLALCTAFAVAAQSPVIAQPSGVDGDVIDVEVLPGWRKAGMEHVAALRLTLAPGWKTYWRAPGDAGIPPNFDWTGSDNVVNITPHWPVPEIFNQNGMRSIGYSDEVIIPLYVQRARSSDAIHLRAEIQIGVCEDICIPAFVSIDTMLPPQGGMDDDIMDAIEDRPMTEGEASVSAVNCRVVPTDDGLGLTITVDMPPMGKNEAAAIETADPSVWVAEPEITRQGNTLTAKTELIRYNAEPFALDRSGVRMTVFSTGEAVDIQGCTAG